MKVQDMMIDEQGTYGAHDALVAGAGIWGCTFVIRFTTFNGYHNEPDRECR